MTNRTGWLAARWLAARWLAARWLAARWLAALLAVDLVLSAAWLAAAAATAPHDRDGEAVAILWGGHGRLGQEDRRRLGRALAVWRDGAPSRPVFCIGGARPAEGFSGARLLCDELAAAGIPLRRLRIGGGSNDTVSNLHELAGLAHESGIGHVLVVADPLQTMRIRLLLTGAAGGVALSWAPYDYWTVQPRPGLFSLWLSVQHEFIGSASLLLPDRWRRRLIDWLRP